jgi:hypothetical protein
MLAKEFTERVQRELDCNEKIAFYLGRAKSEEFGFMDASGNWIGKTTVEQTLFLVLLMPFISREFICFNDKMPWKQLCSLFNINTHKAYRSWALSMSDNYKVLKEKVQGELEKSYPKVYQLFR